MVLTQVRHSLRPNEVYLRKAADQAVHNVTQAHRLLVVVKPGDLHFGTRQKTKLTRPLHMTAVQRSIYRPTMMMRMCTSIADTTMLGPEDMELFAVKFTFHHHRSHAFALCPSISPKDHDRFFCSSLGPENAYLSGPLPTVAHFKLTEVVPPAQIERTRRVELRHETVSV